MNRTLASSHLPLLITGAAGVAGFNAFHYFRALYPGQVIGIRPAQTWQLVGEGIIEQEAEDAEGMRRLFDAYSFRTVLNATGNCALKSCELDPIMANQLNVASAHSIVENVRRHNCRLVHLSTDLVFSGTLGRHHDENDFPDPVTIYGKTMLQGEEVIAEGVPNAAILRISLPMGPSFNRHAGAIDWIQSRFRKDRPATLYFDEVRSCTYTDDLNTVFAAFLASNWAGLFHCGGPRSLTLYQIGQIVNRIGGYRAELLHGCPRVAAGPMPPRAGDCTMSSEKLYRLLEKIPFRAWPVGDEFPPCDRSWHHTRPGGNEGSLAHLESRLYRYASVSSSEGSFGG